MFSKIQIDWRKKEWHITTDVRTGSGVSGKKPRKKCCGNKFEIVKDGKTVKKVTVKDVNGSKYVLEAMDKGMEITNTDNELMESIVVGNNYISVSGDKVVKR